MATPPLKQVFPILQADDAFVVTPSDSEDITTDAGNTNGYTQVLVKNATGTDGAVKVTTVHGTDIVLFIKSGALEPIAVKKIWSTSTTVTTIHAYVGHQRI